MDDIKENSLETVYDEKDEQQDWFQKVKRLCRKSRIYEPKKDWLKQIQKHSKRDVAKFCEGLRVMLTASLMSPNLYDLVERFMAKNVFFETLPSIPWE